MRKVHTINTIAASLGSSRLLPVLTIDRPDHAEPVGEALVRAGITHVEVTLRTAAALDALQILSRNPRLVVGVGTVLDPSQAEQAIAAGAKFAVSPGLDETVTDVSLRHGIPMVAGVATPTEIQRARRAGLTELKFFPAEALGGVSALRALSAPFPDITWIPTGGINEANYLDYLKIPTVAGVGGSWMVDRALLAAGRFDEVERLASQAVASAGGPRND